MGFCKVHTVIANVANSNMSRSLRYSPHLATTRWVLRYIALSHGQQTLYNSFLLHSTISINLLTSGSRSPTQNCALGCFAGFIGPNRDVSLMFLHFNSCRFSRAPPRTCSFLARRFPYFSHISCCDYLLYPAFTYGHYFTLVSPPMFLNTSSTTLSPRPNLPFPHLPA